MNELQIFENTEFGEIRTIFIEDEAWFIGKDVSEKLGYKDTEAMSRRLDDDEKRVVSIDIVNNL